MNNYAFMQKLPIGLALYNKEGRLVDHSETMKDLLGPALEESTFWDLLSYCQVNQGRRLFKEALNGKELLFEMNPQRGDKKFFYVKRMELSKDPYILILLDPKMTIKHLEDLQYLDKIKGEILNSTSEIVTYQDLDMRILWANKRSQIEFSLSLEDVQGHYCYEVWYQREEPCFACPVLETIKTQKPKESIMVLGSIYRHIRSYPLYTEGVFTGVFSFIMDITERMNAERELNENRLKIKNLHQISFRMDGSKTEDQICKLTVEAAERILDLHLCSLDLVEGDFFVVKAISSGVTPEGSREMPITEGIGGKCLREGKTYVGNIQDFKEAKPAKGSYRSVISIPIGRMGVFQAISLEKNAFSVEDVELAELLISHTKEALKRIRTEERLRFLSFHDSLTGLYNRSFFEEELKRLDIERQLPLSILVVDVNGLKLINDNFGHQEGDRFLKRVAMILKKSCGSEDIIARCGGDEFTLLLPQTDQQRAQLIKKRIKEYSREGDGDSIPMTMALGIETKTSPKQDIYHVLKQAEDGMYEDKFRGRSKYHELILEKFFEGLMKRNRETELHFQGLKEMAILLGKKMLLSQEKMMDLLHLVRLHDIGLIRLSQEILNKEGQLSRDEWEMIKKHPEFGYSIVRSFDDYLSVADAVLSHHERWDGKGYPYGLKGEEIPLLSRIFSVLDAFMCMTKKDLYRKPLCIGETVMQLQGGAGTQFDPNIVEMFLEVLMQEGFREE